MTRMFKPPDTAEYVAEKIIEGIKSEEAEFMFMIGWNICPAVIILAPKFLQRV